MNLSSQYVENAIDEISKLPGIGKKTALRLVLYLIKSDTSQTTTLTEALMNLKTQLKNCLICSNISDENICSICKNQKRDKTIICVVEDLPDLIAIENTAQFTGTYHVLQGLISPIEGVSPQDLTVEKLVQRIEKEDIKEIILALSPTMEGDTTAYYITKKIQKFSIRITTLARGVPLGGHLEYTDEITLGRSLLKRIDFQGIY